MENTLKIIKTYGATAVLMLWLANNNLRIKEIEEKLYKCYEDQISMNMQPDSYRVNNVELIAIKEREVSGKERDWS
jgi:hypothetical protein